MCRLKNEAQQHFFNHVCPLLHLCTAQLRCNGGRVDVFHPWWLMLGYMSSVKHTLHLSPHVQTHGSGVIVDFNVSPTTAVTPEDELA